MRLLNLTIRNFRGFGSSAVQIVLDADLVLMYGPNGFGKTSLAEAIEWLFYGTTRRRQRGDSYSKNEFEGCFPNAHGNLPVEVTATVRTTSGRQHTIARRIPDRRNDALSETLIDGTPTPLSSIGLVNIEGVHPVVAQHDLQTFIHSRPKERRDLISAALGLDELTTLKTALDGARKSFSATPPPGVAEARAKLRTLAEILTNLAETRATAQRWLRPAAEVKPVEDLEALATAARRLAGTTSFDSETLLNDLRSKRQQLSLTVFDTRPLIPPTDAAAIGSRLETETINVANTSFNLSKDLSKAVAASATAYGTAILQFWETGLRLAPATEICPMCEESTLTAAKRTMLEVRLKGAQEALVTNKQVAAAATLAATALSRAKQAIEYASIPGINIENRPLLTRLLAGQPTALAAFLAFHDEFLRMIEEAQVANTALHDFLTRIPEGLTEARRAEELVSDSTAIPERFATATARLGDALSRYSVAWTTFEPALAAAISSNKAITEIDAVGKALKCDAELRVLAAYDLVSGASRTLMQDTEAHLQEKQTSLLSSRGQDIKTVYDLLNPGAQVGFETMEPGNEQLRLHATSFGVRMSAAANPSECQLNCLGLSFWLGNATAAGTPFGFLLLDDPVQSMDDDHCEAFIGTLMPSLCDHHNKQVLLLSHERKLIDRIRDLNKARDALIYHYDEYGRTGPFITQQVNLAVMLREVEGLAKGNEANRATAVDKLRKVGEQFIRDLHIQQTSKPAPPEYDSATPSELLELFRAIPGTLPAEFQNLKDTFDFAAPAHHQQTGYSVPVTTNITPHIDRLRNLMKKYKLLR